MSTHRKSDSFLHPGKVGRKTGFQVTWTPKRGENGLEDPKDFFLSDDEFESDTLANTSPAKKLSIRHSKAMELDADKANKMVKSAKDLIGSLTSDSNDKKEVEQLPKNNPESQTEIDLDKVIENAEGLGTPIKVQTKTFDLTSGPSRAPHSDTAGTKLLNTSNQLLPNISNGTRLTKNIVLNKNTKNSRFQPQNITNVVSNNDAVPEIDSSFDTVEKIVENNRSILDDDISDVDVEELEKLEKIEVSRSIIKPLKFPKKNITKEPVKEKIIEEEKAENAMPANEIEVVIPTENVEHNESATSVEPVEQSESNEDIKDADELKRVELIDEGKETDVSIHSVSEIPKSDLAIELTTNKPSNNPSLPERDETTEPVSQKGKTSDEKFTSPKEAITEHENSKTVKTPTKASYNPPKLTPKSTDATPKSTDATSKSTDATPKSTDATPKSTKATPKSTKATPKSTKVTPKSTKATSTKATSKNSNSIKPITTNDIFDRIVSKETSPSIASRSIKNPRTPRTKSIDRRNNDNDNTSGLVTSDSESEKSGFETSSKEKFPTPSSTAAKTKVQKMAVPTESKPRSTKTVKSTKAEPTGPIRRSSRVRVPPVASWKNEKIVYKTEKINGVVVKTLQNVLHKADDEPLSLTQPEYREPSRRLTKKITIDLSDTPEVKTLDMSVSKKHAKNATNKISKAVASKNEKSKKLNISKPVVEEKKKRSSTKTKPILENIKVKQTHGNRPKSSKRKPSFDDEISETTKKVKTVEHKSKSKELDLFNNHNIDQDAKTEWQNENDGKLTLSIFEGPGTEKQIDRTVAFAPNSYKNNTIIKTNEEYFRVRTLFDQDSEFCGGGIIELPSGSKKAVKSNHDTYFIFYVIVGEVEVTLSRNIFTVTEGCSFEIPMGNYYQFVNTGTTMAKMMFVQSKYIVIGESDSRSSSDDSEEEEEDDDDDDAESSEF